MISDKHPLKGYFENFAEEKEFRKTHRPSSGEAWGDLGIATINYSGTTCQDGVDPDLFETFNLINRIDFLYSKMMSCSGSFKDHGRYLNHTKEYGIDRSGMQGFLMLRADTTHPRFHIFKDGLEKLCEAELNFAHFNDSDNKYQRQTGIYNMALQIKVPDEVLNISHPKHETYLTDAWNHISSYLRTFISDVRIIKIKLRNKNKSIETDPIKEVIKRNHKKRYY
ncbi:MAG: hypothetical protein ACLFUO_02090 [Candidatus Woesearchaeota archaeon]